MKEKKFKGKGAHSRLLPAVIIAAVMVLAAVAVLTPATETDAAIIKYIDIDGVVQDSPVTTIDLTVPGSFGGVAPNFTLTGASGAEWFYVDNNITLAGTLTIQGPIVYLIIGAGNELTVEQGVIVSGTTIFSIYTEDPGAGTPGSLYVSNGDAVTINEERFENTAYITATLASGSNGVRYSGPSFAQIYNGPTGYIYGSANGIFVTNSNTTNWGKVDGGECGFRATDDTELYNSLNPLWAPPSITGGSTGIYADNVVYVYLNQGEIYGNINGVYSDGELLAYNFGSIIGGEYGICSPFALISNYENGEIKAETGGTAAIGVDYDCIINNEGLISGPNGILVGYMSLGHIYNAETGVIEGVDGLGLAVADGDGIVIRNDGGYIWGEEVGIFLVEYGSIYNYVSANNVVGVIEGNQYHGIYLFNGSIIYNEGDIEGGMVGIVGFLFTDVENYGDIYGGDYGIWSEYLELYNDGSVEGDTEYGIYVIECEVYNYGSITGGEDGIRTLGAAWIYNHGGEIYGGENGIALFEYGNIFNYVTVSGVAGIIRGDTYNGILLDAGGMVYNEGCIVGANNGIYSGTDGIDLKQLGSITGDVVLCDTTSNTVTFGAGSTIEGNINIGGDGSSLYFVKGIGDLSGRLYYAYVDGIVILGNQTATVWDIQDLPATYGGEYITLIDAHGGITGTPKLNTVSPPALTYALDLWIAGFSKLMAGKLPIVVPLPNYKITASADSGSTISPAGISTVSGGSNKTFTFSAKAGYIISEVKIDGAFSLTQAEVNSGSYTFTNVTSDHTIVVKSIAGTASNITLTVIVKEGNGYAEYNTGSGFVKYTGPIALTAGTNVQLRAVADDGFLFDKWETPSVETNSAIAINNIQSSKSVNLYFSSEDSGNPSSSNVIWYVLLIILILLVIFVVYFLWKRSKNKG